MVLSLSDLDLMVLSSLDLDSNLDLKFLEKVEFSSSACSGLVTV